ncbi:G patch domain-containing protein 1 [Halocaridina rubra]|uniref:G patch domain-containing protein 1 n=1 Tax=Halocaridina rubra TaxID=373956 RepID=A0AAN8WV70_HALRR
MDDSDDDVCYFGTPLEELDADDVQPAKAPRIEDQVALDKQGRRRFHGAFTGGFSAGYFNSVGTEDGWTPSTYVSSRALRADTKQAKPQDFMDNEDLEVHGIAPQAIQATASFDDNEHRKRKRVVDPSGPIPGVPVLEEILRPNKETMGMKLLRQLGWKPGQGVGPRVKLSQKKVANEETKKIYGCQRPQDKGSGSDEDLDEEDCDPHVTFAPNDVETLHLSNPKSDQFGLGYKPLDRTSVLGGHFSLFDPSPLVMTEKKKKLLIKGQAFGVGVFEEEDEDIYATEDMSHYDFGDDTVAPKAAVRKPKSHMELMGLMQVIDGFHLSNESKYMPKKFPLPILPKDFSPYHKPRRRRFQLKESEMQGLGRHDITSEQRARIISEKNQATFEIRSGVKGKLPESPITSKASGEDPKDTFDVDKLYEEFQSFEGTSGVGYKPFARDEAKQRRYELYMKMKERGQKDRYYLAQPKSMTEWERERELQEFDRASKLFKPLISTMASRFVTAALGDGEPKLKDGLNKEIPKDSEPSTSGTDFLGQDVTDDVQKAAKMNMFGKLTQSAEDWYPDRLLCRRFNIPDPYPDSNFTGVRRTKREKFSIFSMLEVPSVVNKSCVKSSSTRDSPLPPEKEEYEKGDDEENHETYGLKVPINGPPTMDLFKAIFQDSDSDDEKASDETVIVRTTVDDYTHTQGLTNISQTVEEPSSAIDAFDIQTSSKASFKTSVDSFLSNMRQRNASDCDSDGEPIYKLGQSPLKANQKATGPQERTRVSRFEPKRDSSTGEIESLPKPVFVSRKKAEHPSEAVPAKGIFANLDFNLLNSYRYVDQNCEEKTGEQSNLGRNMDVSYSQPKSDSDSSLDSDETYGPPIPTHLKNRPQMIKSLSKISSSIANKNSKGDEDTQWVVKDEKLKDRKQYKNDDREKSKRKKEKKKKKNKVRKHKKKTSKKHRRSSSDSSSEFSE